jgi:Membrane bound O-acyl transferase family
VARALVASTWVLFIVITFAAEWCSRGMPALLRMFAIIVPVFFCMKFIVTAMTSGRGSSLLRVLPWCAFACGWAGMRPGIFQTLGNPPLVHAREMILSGLMRVSAGAFLVWVAREVSRFQLDRTLSLFLVSALLLWGYSLILHFGLLKMSAGFWRGFGVRAEPLFKNPFASRGLRDFWSRRWNLAFSEMTAVAVHRPLSRILGARVGLLVSFLFSGILHELAVSVPVMSGFGKPLLYFLLQGIGVWIEETLTSKTGAFSGKAMVLRVWTFIWVLAPVPLLFHPGFLAGIVWPLAGLTYPECGF